MFLLIFSVVFVAIAALIALGIYGLGAAIKSQAQKETKRFFAPVPRPGSFSFISVEGKIVDLIENVIGWHTKKTAAVKNAKCFVISTDPGRPEPKKFLPYLLEHYLGVVWIGIYATIKNFPDWQWSEFKQVEVTENGVKTLKYEVITREAEKGKKVESFFFQFPYPVILDDAEIHGNIRVKIVAVFTVLHIHPIRAFFLNKDPVSLFNAMVLSVLRDYVRDKDFNNVKGIKASGTAVKAAIPKNEEGDAIEKKEKEFWEVIETLNGIKIKDDGNPDYDNIDQLGLFGKLGYLIVRGEVLQVEAVGEAAKAIEAERIAELQGEAKVKEAEKRKEATLIDAEADALAMDKRREARMKWVNDTVVAPIKEGGSAVGNVLEAEHVASPTSKVVTWVKGSGAVVSVPTEKEK